MHIPPTAIQRYDYMERASHWLLAISFFLAGLSGLAFFHPSMFWLTNLFGGGTWTRILHPFLGLAMAVFFIALGLRVWHHNLIDDSDVEWLKHAGEVMAGHEDRAPPGRCRMMERTDVGLILIKRSWISGPECCGWSLVACPFLLEVPCHSHPSRPRR